ncbi:MAG TPA: Rne/Rng family ribonuclease [Granulicella sp.]|jgi:ribonuclease E|nr:Rne/Rng family ribonuclease [Granulicella sp.]
MSKEIYISSTPHETRLAIVENDALTEIYYERENEYTLAGSIYNGRVTRVLPGMQSSFVDIGLERDAFLYITDFLEEAGDSADFEGASADGESRSPRGDGQRRDRGGRGDGSDRPDRSDRGERPTTIEGTLASPSDRSSSRGEEGVTRSDRGDRNGRGDRGRRRGRGDRDRNGSLDASRGADSTMTPPPPSVPAVPPVDELGEGAPGADGSRRWRGRRGRRRGRGALGSAGDPARSASADASPDATGDHSYTDASESSFAGQSQGYAQEEFTDYPVEIDRVAAELPQADTHTESAESEQSRAEGQRGEGRREGGRNERNERGGRGEGREGRGRNDRNQRPPRAPRGFAPSRDLYAVDSTEAGEELAAPVEPIILPGESLSKYRAASEPEASATPDVSSHAAGQSGSTPAVNVILPKPKTVVDETVIAAGWDGGFTLPGETLSRRSRSESQPAPRSEKRNEPRASHRMDDRSNLRAAAATSAPEDQAGLPQVVEDLDGLSVATTPEQQPEVAEAAHPERVSESEILHEAVPSGSEAIAAAPETEAPAVNTEYEPEEASASYRVDPIAPSEFRQSGGTAEPETVEVPATQEPAPHLDTTGVPPPPPPMFAALTAEEGSGADITSISATGEMHSEPVMLPAEAAAESVEQATSPMQHEAAVHEATAQSFSPGKGALEEEFLEDEELDGATLHAGYDEEFEDLEEETLEGAADLGTMLREMSIDQITAPGDAEEGDEEFEEEEADEAEYGDPDSASEDEDFVEGDKPSEHSAADAEFFAATFREPETEEGTEGGERTGQEVRRGRRDGRRGRSGDRERGRDRDRGSRSTGGDHDRSRSGGRRQSAQATNLPAISDLLKPGQEILVQIAKEPIAKKGARITSHIALPGRFLVFMPTVNHTGVSRKIESDGERRRLKEILLSEKGEASGGFIVRTAAAGASEEELRSDLRFLLNLWTDIKQRSEASKSPALIYHDLNLVERILRDQVTDTFSAIWVDTESEYERVLRFLQRFQPSLIRRVKLYTKETPLFEQFGITEEINKALRSKVWLKSGGSIVINQTEALVAIDINTGKFVGKTARLEDTIVKTNLDAIPEIVRQIRLRDLGGIIIIDFIDMDERRNRNKVMAALEEELKTDRAPSKVLQFNDFGLVAITRKRVKQSLERTLSTTCGVCQGTGMVKSPITVCNDIYIEMRKMHKHLDRGDVMLRVHPDVIKQLKSGSSKWLQEMEEMVGKTILIKSDPSLHPEQFDIH